MSINYKLSDVICRVIKGKNDFLKEYLKNLKTLKKECFYFLFEGKSIRTILTGLSAVELKLPLSEVIPFCAAMELIHLYSIIHDDLPAMDNTLYRRDKQSIHIAFGESSAILVGDLLQNKAYYILFKFYSKNEELVKLFFDAAGDKGIIRGQVYDIANKFKIVPSKELINIYRFKTAALFQLATVASAIIKGVNRNEKEFFKNIGQIFGITYQIKDDLEDRLDTVEPNIVKSTGLSKSKKIYCNYRTKLLNSTKHLSLLNEYVKTIFPE